MVVFGQSSCIRAKLVVIGQKQFYSVKSGSTRAIVVLGQSCCIRVKVVVLGQKWL